MEKPKVLDRTKNFSGPDNMIPPDRLQPDCLTTLYDEFVRDGWMKPEDRTALDRYREKALREAADELRGQGYGAAVRTILALIEKPNAR